MMRLAMIQMNVDHDKRKNLAHARALLREAVWDGIDLAVLPEMFCCPYSNRFFRAYSEEGGQRFQESAVLSPGDQITVFDTEFGKIGLCICFDFRFRELAKPMLSRRIGFVHHALAGHWRPVWSMVYSPVSRSWEMGRKE